MIKAVLFDYGGVLTRAGTKGDVEKSLALHYKMAVEDLKVDDLVDGIRRGKIKTEDFFLALAKRFPSDNPMTEEAFIDRHKEMRSRSMEVYDLAERLRKHGIKTGILSNIFEMTAAALRVIGVYKSFDPVILSCEVKMAKPDPEIYQLAVRKLDVKPSEIVFIDDQAKCWPPAEKIGIKVIKAKSPSQIVREVTSAVRQENKLLL
jgi:epoxide hydrolase-like predicted phosphatase